MRRTQLYLEDDIWNLLHVLAERSGSTVSELVRQAVREKFVERSGDRKQALMSIAGLWKDRTDLPDTEAYVRNLRRGTRLQRIHE